MRKWAPNLVEIERDFDDPTEGEEHEPNLAEKLRIVSVSMKEPLGLAKGQLLSICQIPRGDSPPSVDPNAAGGITHHYLVGLYMCCTTGAGVSLLTVRSVRCIRGAGWEASADQDSWGA